MSSKWCSKCKVIVTTNTIPKYCAWCGKDLREEQIVQLMPRIHKTLYSSRNPNGEYRRIVSGKYIIIYQIQEEQINILRIYSSLS